MKKILLLMSILSSSMTAVIAQQEASCIRKDEVLLEKNKPTLFLTFERTGKCQPAGVGLKVPSFPCAPSNNEAHRDDIEVVWLRLHNNIRWAVNFTIEYDNPPSERTLLQLCDGRKVSGLRDGTEADVPYKIEIDQGSSTLPTPPGKGTKEYQYPPKVPLLPRGHILGTAWLASGSSVVFAVPREYLERYLMVVVPVNFEWATKGTEAPLEGPYYDIYFRASDLPKDLK